VKDVSARLPGDRPWLRLAVRLPEENARLVAALAVTVAGMEARA
jgi:hypothetical protein